MRCTEITYRPEAHKHFFERYSKYVARYVEYNELLDAIIRYYRSSKIKRNTRHKEEEREGPRYQIDIKLGLVQIRVIIEKTPTCLLPITTYPYSRKS